MNLMNDDENKSRLEFINHCKAIAHFWGVQAQQHEAFGAQGRDNQKFWLKEADNQEDQRWFKKMEDDINSI